MGSEAQAELDRIESNVAAAYSAAEEQGADMPDVQNTDNLAKAVGSIKSVKFTEQALTDAQKKQARTNIGLDIFDYTSDKRDIYVDMLGVKRGSATYATANSAIMDTLMAGLSNGFTIHFGSGHYYFANPIVSSKHVTFKGYVSNACNIENAVNYGSYLHFPELADGEAAISLPGGVVQDLGIIGNPSICDVSIDRTKTVTGPDSIVTTTDNGTTYGVRFSDAWTITVQNVRVMNCTYGVYTPTGNGLISGFIAEKCKIGISVGNDMKINNVQVWNVMVGVELRGALASVSNLRGDSIGEHLVVCVSGKCLLVNIDGDYCVGSLIHYGDGTSKMIHLGQAVACMGRVATKHSFALTDGFDLSDIPDEDYAFCSYISIAPNTLVFGGQIDVINVAANPFDTNAGQYYHPNAVISIAKNSTVKGVTVKCNAPYDANEQYFGKNVIKNLSIYAAPYNSSGSYITDFDGHTIEDICFITPSGSVRSRRTVEEPNRQLDAVSVLFNKMDDFVSTYEVLVPGVNLNDGIYEAGYFDSSGNEYVGSYAAMSFRNENYLPVEGGRDIALYYDAYEWNNNNKGKEIYIVQYDSNKNVINGRELFYPYVDNNKAFTLSDNTAFIRIAVNKWSEITTKLTDIKVAIYYIEDVVKEFVEYEFKSEKTYGVKGEKVVLTSPNGTRYTLEVSDDGTISVIKADK